MKIFSKSLFTLFILSYLSSANAQNQQNEGPVPIDSLTDRQLEEVIITAGRIPQMINDIPQKTEVVTLSDIRSTPALEVTDILKKNTSLNVIQYPGLVSGVGIRGFRPQFSGLNQRTLLLVNGRPAGTTSLGFLDVMNIDRIEVLKRPASALYGSGAMGGVVNIITPTSTGPVEGLFNLNYGSYHTFQTNARVGGEINGKFDFDLSAGVFNRNADFKLGSGNLIRNLLGADQLRNVYSDGLDTLTLEKTGDGETRPNTQYGYYTPSSRIGYKIDSTWRVDLSGSSFIANHVESPGDIFSGEAGEGLKGVKRYSADISIQGKYKNHELLARAYLSTEKTNSMAIRDSKGNVIDPSYLARKTNYEWQGVQIRDAITIAQHKIIVGYDYENAKRTIVNYNLPQGAHQNETTTTPNSSLSGHGFYGQGQLNFLQSRLIINPGIRLDLRQFSILKTPSYSRTLITGTKNNTIVSPSLAGQYYLHPNLSLHASAGRAFVTPDAANVAGYVIIGKGTGQISVSRGNPELKNENSLSQDVGLRFANSQHGLSADITYFNTRVYDRIANISQKPNQQEIIDGDTLMSETTYFNSDKSKINGLELLVTYDFGSLHSYAYSLRVFVNLTYYLNAEDLKKTDNDSYEDVAIPNIAKANLNYGVEYNNFKNISARLSGRYTGNRWDTDFTNPLRPRVYYPEFMVFDTSIGYTFKRQHQITLMVENLTDENYYEKRGYNMPGRNFRIRYTYSFN